MYRGTFHLRNGIYTFICHERRWRVWHKGRKKVYMWLLRGIWRLWSPRSIPVTSPTIISRHSRRIILADGASWWLSGGPSRAEVRTIVTGRYWRAVVTDRPVYVRACAAVTGRCKFSLVAVRYEHPVLIVVDVEWFIDVAKLYNA